jgi:hypothetical protein
MELALEWNGMGWKGLEWDGISRKLLLEEPRSCGPASQSGFVKSFFTKQLMIIKIFPQASLLAS